MDTRHAADCLVVGAGPAGLTAAIYLRRYLRHVVVFDHGHSRALSIECSRNYPAFAQGLSGHALLQLLHEQLVGVGGDVVAGEVTTLQRLPRGGFAVQSGSETWPARTVLLATGVADRVPALPGIEQVQQRGLLRQCPICDGYEQRGRRIVVLGDGPHAAREAAFIADYSAHVAHAGLAEVPAAAPSGVRSLPEVAVRIDPAPEGGVRIALAGGETHDFDLAYAALGSQPRSLLGRALGAQVDAHESLEVDAHGATTLHGLYAAGDVVKGLDQLAVAVGQGAVAATAIHNLLREATT